MNRRSFFTYLGLSWLSSLAWVFILPHSDKSRLLAQDQKGTVFYVAPNGNDEWSGTQLTATASDGPFATITRARDAIRELKKQQGGKLQQPVTVYLRGGTYFLKETLTLTDEDSGSAEAPITYTAYQNEKPIISGGQPLSGWKSLSLRGKQYWVVDLPEDDWFFRQMWVNGDLRRRSRYPNKGYLPVEAVPDTTQNTPWHEGQNSFVFRQGDLKDWETIDQAEVVVMSRWTESRLPVKKIDTNDRLITFDKNSVMKIDPGNSSSPGAGIYYIENVLEILDTPGEWFLNRDEGRLYYLPIPGEDINTLEAIAPILPVLVELIADPQQDKNIAYLSFEKITFAHAQWYSDRKLAGIDTNDDISGFGQSAIGVPGTIRAIGVRYCTWRNCTVAHTGNYGIEFYGTCFFNQVIGCVIFDLGAGGIKIAAGSNNKIVGSHIYNGGLLFPSAAAIWVGNAANNQIARNYIHDFYASAISVGWTWGYGNSLAKNNIIELNHIHHIGLRSDGDGPILNDKGAIYTLGIQPGTIIRSNLIYDIDAYNYGGWGIYLDEGSSQILVEGNLVHRTRDGGFHQNAGKDNIIRNNVFAFGKVAQIRRSSNENHLSFTFERNIVYWGEGKLLEGKWDNMKYSFDRNIYWHVGGGKITFNNLPLSQWQKLGMDKNSLIANPLFVAPQTGNFQLQSRSPALKLGFNPLASLQ